jgi:hypothetical protein
MERYYCDECHEYAKNFNIDDIYKKFRLPSDEELKQEASIIQELLHPIFLDRQNDKSENNKHNNSIIVLNILAFYLDHYCTHLPKNIKSYFIDAVKALTDGCDPYTAFSIKKDSQKSRERKKYLEDYVWYYKIYFQREGGSSWVTIYDNENNKWCCVKDYNKAIKTDYKPQKLYSLSTSNHNIQIDNHTFSDYEEISNDKNSCLLINHYIMSDINKHLSFSDNLLNVQNVKNLDSGFVGQTLIRMNDNTLKNINSLEINDILFNNNRVIGIIKILAKDFIWYKCNNIISTDNCKYYIDNSCYPVNHKNLEISINDDFGYNIITELGYIMIHSNNNIDYKYLDFIQVSNIDVQDKITEIALTYMNRK